MTKQEFVDAVADKAACRGATRAPRSMRFSTRSPSTLKNGDAVTFTGFGKFTTAARAARQGVNPRNRARRCTSRPPRVPKFTAGSQLKAAVKG